MANTFVIYPVNEMIVSSLESKERQSPYLSIGFIINGILARPMAVVTLFLVVVVSVGAIFNNDILDRRHILLIVKPGIMTDANACHNAASRKTSTDFLYLVLSV